MVGRLSDPIFKITRGDYVIINTTTRCNIFHVSDLRQTLTNIKRLIYMEVEEVLKYKKSMEIKFRLQATFEKKLPEFDGRTEKHVEQSPLATKQAKTITRTTYKQIVDDAMEELFAQLREFQLKTNRLESRVDK